MSLGALGQAVSQRHLSLLVSSLSARGRALSVGPRVVRILREGGWRVDVHVTTPDEDPTEIARSLAAASSGGAVASGRSPSVAPASCEAPADAPVPSPAPGRGGVALVGALGGDGYISAVAQGLADSDAVLVPLPGGRGNDLCRAVGAGADPVGRARSLAALGLVGQDEDPALLPPGRRRCLDGIWVGSSDADEGDRGRLVLGVVSFGLEAWANIIANESRLRSGPLAYAYGALAAPMRYRPADFRVLIDGVEHDMGGWALSLSNSGCIGGGIRVVPSSDPCDGQLELLHVGRMPLRRALPILARIVLSRDAEDPAVEVTAVREVLVAGPVGMPAMADGDRVGTLPLCVRIAAGVVDLLV